MIRHLRSTRSLLTTTGLVALALAGTGSAPVTARSDPGPRCRNVNGHYAEHAAPSSSCPSPVGLCIEGDFSGAIRGSFAVTATSFTPTAETPATAVVPFTGDGVIHAQIGDARGDLFFKSAGAFHTVGTGEIVDLQFITGGAGAFTGVSGALRASGTFDPAAGSGESEYTGTVCFP
jgi:hypothetical protein